MHDDGVCALALAVQKRNDRGVPVAVIDMKAAGRVKDDTFNDRMWTRI
jgi:hypothetical protein